MTSPFITNRALMSSKYLITYVYTANVRSLHNENELTIHWNKYFRALTLINTKTIKMKKVVLRIALVAVLGLSFTSCRETKAESAEDKVEEAMDDAGNAIDEAGDAIEDAVDDAGDALEEAGDAVEDAVDDAGNAVGDAVDKATEN